MDKRTKFKPMTFLEVDDLFGGRKTVMVGSDGITYWDAMDSETTTPLVIHPVFKPVEIGPLIEFARRNDLLDALRSLTLHISETQEGRSERDPLYVMRVLVWYSKGACDGSVAAIQQAVAEANEEEERAIRAQAIFDQYVQAAEQDAGKPR